MLKSEITVEFNLQSRPAFRWRRGQHPVDRRRNYAHIIRIRARLFRFARKFYTVVCIEGVVVDMVGLQVDGT